jgi:hypothetical protein
VVAEKLKLRATLDLRREAGRLLGQLTLSAPAGQALAGPVFLDLAAHPTDLRSDVEVEAQRWQLSNVRMSSSGLADASGAVLVAFDSPQALREMNVTVSRLLFPAAYTTLLQLPLATTNFGNLNASGELAGSFEVRANQLTAIDLGSRQLDFEDATRKLMLKGLAGEFHWRAANSNAPVSTVSWKQYQAFGLHGDAASISVRAAGDGFTLVNPMRLPLFDGALAVQRFDARGLGTQSVTLGFDGAIERIGMPRLSRAFGWPELSGTLSGRLPGLEYRAGTLAVAGDITAEVFDGTITINNLQLRNAFSGFPRFSGAISARRLDLELITRAIPIGSMTGHLDADIRGLELFNWSPVAFDANLYSSPGDRTRHRISQRAVNSLANMGGGGGGVMAALQSGFLRFFDDFGYERIGIRCQLRNDVCLMDGIARPGGGFYLVKGGGVPRLDVVGNSGRVAWSQLVSQIGSAIRNGAVEVR